MNTTVTATGMSVKANSDNIFLQISNTSETYIDPAVTAIATETPPEDGLKLVTYDYDDSKWKTGTSTDPSKVAEGTVLTEVATLSDYVMVYKFYIRLAPNGVDAEDLTIERVTFDGGANTISDSFRIRAVGPDGEQMYNAGTGEVSEGNLADKVTTDEIEIILYVYFDGTDDSAYTNNATDVSNVTADVKFKVN